MKFFLARGVTILAPKARSSSDQALGIRPMSAKITSNDIIASDGDGGTAQLCNKLRQRLNLSAGLGSSYLLLFEIVIGPGESSRNCNNRLRIPSSLLTTALTELFGKDVTIQIILSNLYVDCLGLKKAVAKVSSSKMNVRNYGAYAWEDDMYFGGVDVISNNSLRGELTIVVRVADDVGTRLETTDKLQAYKKMLLEGIRSDVVIVLDNGEQVKAHTNVLAAHSAVFYAMFESDMKEAKTSTLEMRDMSVEGVRAMLAYLYYREYLEPNAKSVVAFEMFHAGHKYDIPMLEADMKKLLLTKAEEWYEVDVAMKLYLLAKKLPEDGEGLKMKAIRVLKKNSANLNESPTYVALFQEDIEAAMELCKSLAA